MTTQTLSPEAKAILQLLVNKIRAGVFNPSDGQTFLGYAETHEILGIQRIGPHWGSSLRKQGLQDLAEWLLRMNLPAITGLIVDQSTFLPGDGYFEIYNRPLSDRAWWSDQIKKAIAYDWSPYVEDDPVPSLDDLRSLNKAIVEGKMDKVPVDVRSRCEALRKRTRQYYRSPDGYLRCEVCSWHKPDSRISGDIVELHHIETLCSFPAEGKKLTLQEAIENLRPLCPCCHRIAHSRIGGGTFTLAELKGIIPPHV